MAEASQGFKFTPGLSFLVVFVLFYFSSPVMVLVSNHVVGLSGRCVYIRSIYNTEDIRSERDIRKLRQSIAEKRNPEECHGTRLWKAGLRWAENLCIASGNLSTKKSRFLPGERSPGDSYPTAKHLG